MTSPNDATLEVLLARMREGDLRAAEEVFLAYEPQLRLIVRRKLSSRLRAKFDSADVVQSVWAHVLKNARANGCHLQGTSHLRHFLIRVTLNCLTDRFRRYQTALSREEPLTRAVAAGASDRRDARPSEVAQANELWENLLALCPPEHHELLRLKRQGMPLEAIAARSGLHADSVRRILRKLARQMAFQAPA